MIKVEHTRTHNLNPNINIQMMIKSKVINPNEILVTNAELVLVECNEIKHAILHSIINKNGKFYKPILISETEKIEVGDWGYNLMTKRYGRVLRIFGGNIVIDNGEYEDTSSSNNFAKVLALPEHFSPQQLQMIVDGKLKEGKCLVECVQEEPIPMTYKGVDSRGDYIYYCPKCGWGGSYMGTGQVHCYKDECRPTTIKLNPHITIYPVEEKMVAESELLKVKSELKKYKKAYEILNCYFDSISDEEQPKVARRLDKLGL